ncbi:MAG: substrate-binding domain-containing protein [Burkholderiales bacterium]
MAVRGSIAADEAKPSKPYLIYLSNNYIDNDWRVQMVKTAEVAARKPPLKGKVDLKVVISQNTVQAQINDLNNMIRAKPAAILVDAGSGTALNETIARACAQGILVLSFDQIVTAPCAYKVQSNWDVIPHVVGAWVAAMLKGKGEVAVDRGLPSAPLAQLMLKAYETELGKHPGIKIVGYFNGNFNPGAEQAGVASILAAHPNLAAAITDNVGTSAWQAFAQAGKKTAIVTGYASNGALVTCAKTKDLHCFFGSNSPSLSAEAMKVAVDILDGIRPHKPGDVLLDTPYFSTDPIKIPGYEHIKVQQIVLGENAFADQAAGLGLPVSPAWVQISPAEVAGK